MSFTESLHLNADHHHLSFPLDSDAFYLAQSRCLEYTFNPPNYAADQIFTSSDSNLYFDPCNPQWYKQPDWFAVLGVDKHPHQKPRTSYITWQESFNPFIVIEFLSPETETEDLGQMIPGVDHIPTKWDVYERYLRIPYYIVFDIAKNRLEAFQFVGSQYQDLSVKNQQIFMPDLGLGLGLHSSYYEGVEWQCLHWIDANGNWITLTETQLEQAQQDAQKVLQKRQLIDQKQQQGQEFVELFKKPEIKLDQV